jgi:asparagine synthase (glutamine-hydrolysing)
VCGISGVVHKDATKPVTPRVLHAMNDALAHRGPDDGGIWHRASVGLAHQRLSVLDLTPAGRQPMCSEDGNLVLVYNGEIYNFRELRDELRGLGHVFSTRCDTEVLLHAYREWGDDLLGRLNGMFAFALYDVSRERLLLARDRLGIKPLFYTFHKDTLAFASELDALRLGGFCGDTLNPAALDAYFRYLYIPAPDTIFDQVYKVRPGEKMVLHGGKLTKERYWQPNYIVDHSWTLETAAEAYLELLEDAVTIRRVSDVPLGAFLSGGLDSSTVVAILSRNTPQPVKTFSIGFDDAHVNELEYARCAAGHFGTDHTEEILHPDMISLLPKLVQHYGEPFADSSALPMWLVSRVARKEVTVVLSGDGGDELFAGYTWTHRNHDVARYRRLPRSLRALGDKILRYLPISPRIDRLQRFSGDSFLPPHESFRRRLTCFGDDLRNTLLQPELSAKVEEAGIDRYGEHVERCVDLSPDDQMLYLDSVMYLPDDILCKVDRMSMAHSLEARVPLLDHRLVEFAATVPFALKYGGGISKRLAKHAVRDLLPPQLLRQRKQGFSIPIQRWFREGLGTHFKETVMTPGARCAEYVNPEFVRQLHKAHVAHKSDYGHHLWTLLVFEHWLRDQSLFQRRPAIPC